MSLRSFTTLALSPRKRADSDLRPARIHSTFRSRSFAFHVVTEEQAPTVSAGRQRCGKLPGTVHPLPAGQRRVRGATGRRLWRSGCESNASLSRHLQTDVSVERHLSRIRPCLTRPLARCLSRALRQLRGSASASQPFGFRLSENLFAKDRNAKTFSEPSEKDAAWPWERGTLASLCAGVSRVRTGQIQTGEKQWHSTKTLRN